MCSCYLIRNCHIEVSLVEDYIMTGQSPYIAFLTCCVVGILFHTEYPPTPLLNRRGGGGVLN